MHATARYAVRADISQFYPSLYTHSISWAIHGKAFAKANRGPGILGNDIDTAVRRGQHGQTGGIPIGPDWSLAIAELILSEVDSRLQTQFPGIYGGRRIDDYELGCASQGEAERVLAALRSALADYELQLNSGKTGIIALPDRLIPEWLAEMRSFRFRTTTSGQHDDLIAYFDLAAAHARSVRTAAPLKYLVKRTGSLSLRPANWPIYQYLLMQAILAEPDCIREAAIVLYAHHERGLPIDRERLSELLSLVIARHMPQGGSSEVAWAIWTALVFRVPLPDTVAAEISQVVDSAVALLALDARSRGLIATLDTQLWESVLTADDLRSEHWLLAYEAGVQGWLPTAGHLATQPEFAFLSQHDVRFYDSHRWLDAIPLARAPRPTPTPAEGLLAVGAEPEIDVSDYPF